MLVCASISVVRDRISIRVSRVVHWLIQSLLGLVAEMSSFFIRVLLPNLRRQTRSSGLRLFRQLITVEYVWSNTGNYVFILLVMLAHALPSDVSHLEQLPLIRWHHHGPLHLGISWSCCVTMQEDVLSLRLSTFHPLTHSHIFVLGTHEEISLLLDMRTGMNSLGWWMLQFLNRLRLLFKTMGKTCCFLV